MDSNECTLLVQRFLRCRRIARLSQLLPSGQWFEPLAQASISVERQMKLRNIYFCVAFLLFFFVLSFVDWSLAYSWNEVDASIHWCSIIDLEYIPGPWSVGMRILWFPFCFLHVLINHGFYSDTLLRQNVVIIIGYIAGSWPGPKSTHKSSPILSFTNRKQYHTIENTIRNKLKVSIVTHLTQYLN